MALNDYPIDFRVDYPERSSRGWAALTILLIKFLTLIPHFFVLFFLRVLGQVLDDGAADLVLQLVGQLRGIGQVADEERRGQHPACSTS